MDFFASSRRRRSASRHGFGFPSRQTGLVIFIATFLATFSAGAQVSKAPVPDAPLPRTPQFQVALSNEPSSPQASASVNTAQTGDISLYTVVDLALRHSNKVRIAEAEVQRARISLSETRDAYIPNFALGSGLGPPSYGFPLGNPTLFNVTSNSLVFSFSQRDYTRSTRAALKATTLSLKDTRQQVILDTTTDYIDLTKSLAQIAALHQATADTDKLLDVMAERLHAGLETNMQMTRARLTGAQIHLRTIQMEDHADELRQHLSNLTGLNGDLIQPEATSIPQLPDLDFPSLLRTSPKPPAVLAADATADSKLFAAWGDKRQNYRPTVNFGFQYARFAGYNNYGKYYQPGTFRSDNIEAGIQAVWPLYDPLRRDKADESKAEAVRARRQAELARIQNDEGNLTLWHNLRELEAQEQVADLQQQLAKDTLAATVTQMNHGSADANGAPITPQEAEQQSIDERTSYVDLQDAQFNVTKLKLDLLNAVGGLEDWAREGAQTTGSVTSSPGQVSAR